MNGDDSLKITPAPRRRRKKVNRITPDRAKLHEFFPWQLKPDSKIKGRVRRASGPKPDFPWYAENEAGEPAGCWVRVIERYHSDEPLTVRQIMEAEGVPQVENRIKTKYFFQILRKFEKFEAEEAAAAALESA